MRIDKVTVVLSVLGFVIGQRGMGYLWGPRIAGINMPPAPLDSHPRDHYQHGARSGAPARWAKQRPLSANAEKPTPAPPEPGRALRMGNWLHEQAE